MDELFLHIDGLSYDHHSWWIYRVSQPTNYIIHGFNYHVWLLICCRPTNSYHMNILNHGPNQPIVTVWFFYLLFPELPRSHETVRQPQDWVVAKSGDLRWLVADCEPLPSPWLLGKKCLKMMIKNGIVSIRMPENTWWNLWNRTIYDQKYDPLQW